MNAFYRKVDKLCVKKGITHRELAEQIGVTEVTLSRYLTGQRNTQLSPFMSMCRVLDISAEELFQSYLYASMERRVAKYRKEHEHERSAIL